MTPLLSGGSDLGVLQRKYFLYLEKDELAKSNLFVKTSLRSVEADRTGSVLADSFSSSANCQVSSRTQRVLPKPEVP